MSRLILTTTIGLILCTDLAIAAKITPEARDYYINVVMPGLPTPESFEAFRERFRKSPHSDQLKAFKSAYENTLGDRWHRSLYQAGLRVGLRGTFGVITILFLGFAGLLLIMCIMVRFTQQPKGN